MILQDCKVGDRVLVPVMDNKQYFTVDASMLKSGSHITCTVLEQNQGATKIAWSKEEGKTIKQG